MKLYAIVRSLSSIQREYQFTLTYFIKHFDEAIQGEFPPEYTNDSDDDEGYPEDDTATVVGEKRPASVASFNNDGQTNAKDDQTDKVDKDVTSHQESTTDGAVGTEVKEEDEKIELFELPEVAQLPSEGVDYTSLPGNMIKQMIDNLTSMVFQHTQKSLYVEDRLLFAAMLCLTIQAEGDHFTEEEMSLLLQGNPGLGMQLSLADFDYKGEPPAWLPKDKWEDILAISVLPGPLDSLCVHMAKESDAWKMWYMSDKPEIELLPLSGQNKPATPVDDENRQNQNMTPDLGPLTEFHLLLLLRLLRPDRLPTAMSTYVSKHLNLNLDSQSEFGIEQLLNSVGNQHIGVLVLLPASPSQTDSHPISSISMTFNPTERIKELAEATLVNIQVVTVGEGLDTVIFEAMETAEYNNSWLVVENLHHASDKFFKNLRDLLQRIARRREPKNAKFCVWFTTEPCPRIPMDLLLLLHKLAWDALDTMAKESSSKTGVEAEQSGLLENLLAKAIISTFKSVPTETWETVSGLPQNIKCMIYAFGVAQGLFIARQMFGARGLSQFYHFEGSLYVQAIENVVDLGQAAEENKWDIDDLIDLFSRMIYGQTVCNPWDKDYVITAAHYIISSIIHCQSETVRIGNVDFPVPPANVDPSNYASWFADKISNALSTIGGLSLHGNVDREANDAHAVQFITMMDQLYEAQNLTLGDVQPVVVKQSMNMLRLRAILDNIVEALPPLLELGTIPDDLIKAEYDFPYHQPSVISLATTESMLMPESLGFVLLQECLWHNSLLCHVHQNVHEIHRRLLSGPQSFPRELINTANSIMEEYVPTSWVHPNCQPCTHSITSWLTDLNKRHIQMQSWVKHRMVPVFKEGSQTPESHGILRSVWLGGLVNPQALMVALRQEKAVMAGCRYDEVGLVVEVGELPPDAYDSNQVGGLYLTDLYMQGAMWDLNTNQLTESSHDLNSLPGMHIYPELRSDIRKATRYHCPVFMNRARQVCPFHLDLECSEPVTSWTLSGTAIILDIGIPADSAKKSRAFMMPRQTLSSARSDTSSQHEEMSQQEDEEEEYDFGDDHEVDNHSRQPTERSEESVQSKSQLSYKPMSPQAPPLPPELQLTREPPMIDEQESKHTSPQTKQTPQGPSPDKGSSQSGYSQSITGDKMKKTPSSQSISRMSDRSQRSSNIPKDAVPLQSETNSQQVHSQQQSSRSAASGRSSRHSSHAVTKLDKDSGQGHESDRSKTSARSGRSSIVQDADVSHTSDKRQVSERDSGSVSKKSGIQRFSSGEQLDQAKSSFGSRTSFSRKSDHSAGREQVEHSGSSLSLEVKSGKKMYPESEQDNNAKHSENLTSSEHAETGSRSSAKRDDTSAATPSPHAPNQKSMSQTPSDKGSRLSVRLDQSSDVKPENGGDTVEAQSSHLQSEVTSIRPSNNSGEESPRQP